MYNHIYTVITNSIVCKKYMVATPNTMKSAASCNTFPYLSRPNAPDPCYLGSMLRHVETLTESTLTLGRLHFQDLGAPMIPGLFKALHTSPALTQAPLYLVRQPRTEHLFQTSFIVLLRYKKTIKSKSFAA